MTDIFSFLQSELIKYAQIISEVLKVDIQIIDTQFNRIAGTGYWKDKINENVKDNAYVTGKVFQMGEKVIIHNPRENLICKNCKIKESCKETMEISIPIRLGDKIVGTIECVCVNEKQKKHILNNQSTYIKFIEQIAKLLESRMIEEMEKRKKLKVLDLLDSVLNKVNEGVVIIDKNNCIVKLNKYAMKILRLDKPIGEEFILKPTGNRILKQQEYEILQNNNAFTVVGERYDIDYGHEDIKEVFIFTPKSIIKEQFIELSGVNDNIGIQKIIGKSDAIKELKKKIINVAISESTVLITGESGTGKELVARAIHMESNRANKPFAPVNCAAIPESLLESELFGYTKGAFTGANPKGKIGKMELANGGTLFLDEIGDMPLYMQAKLLRVLEDKSIVRLGDIKEKILDVRIIGATNRNLEKMIKDNSFREDLYYRLNIIPIKISPLRERKEDMKILFHYFLNKYTKLFDKEVLYISEDIWKYLYSYDWHGNVRELQNTVEYLVNMLKSDGIIDVKLLPSKLLSSKKTKVTRERSLNELEREVIKEYLNIYGTNLEGKKKVADKLGIGIATLYRKIKKYGI